MNRLTLSPQADPVDEERKALEAIRTLRWFDCCVKAEHWPVSTETAAALLANGGQFDVTPEGLEDLVHRSIIAAPGLGDDGETFEWSATDVVLASGILEARRQWLPASLHQSKFTAQELCLHVARRDGELEVFDEALKHLDIRQIMALMVLLKTEPERLELAGLLAAVLECRHGVRA